MHNYLPTLLPGVRLSLDPPSSAVGLIICVVGSSDLTGHDV